MRCACFCAPGCGPARHAASMARYLRKERGELADRQQAAATALQEQVASLTADKHALTKQLAVTQEKAMKLQAQLNDLAFVTQEKDELEKAFKAQQQELDKCVVPLGLRGFFCECGS